MTQTLPRPAGATAPADPALAIPGTTVRGRQARVLPDDRPDTTSWAPRGDEADEEDDLDDGPQHSLNSPRP